MNGAAQLAIEAVVDDRERPALNAAAEQLAECMAAAAGSAWPVHLEFRASLQQVRVAVAPAIVVTSLLPELARDDAAATAQRLRANLGALSGHDFADVFLCTIFRHVPRDGATAAITRTNDVAPGTAERIRRLNLLAIDLSHDLGVALLDIDRVFAHVGARALKTDYRLGGAIAAEVAAHTMVTTLLDVTLDDLVAPDVIERARHFHGTLWDINQLLRRRLSPQATKTQSHGFPSPAAIDVADPGV